MSQRGVTGIIGRLSLKNDYLFQRMFGEEESKPILIGLLNAILSRQGSEAIQDVKVLRSRRLTRKLMHDKEAVQDILCETISRERINVEMQVRREPHMEKRSMFYLARLFTGTLGKGKDYQHLKKTIVINLLDYRMFPFEHFHSTFHLYEGRDRQYRLTDLWELHFIEFAKFRKTAFDMNDPLHRLLKYMDESISEDQLKELIEMDATIRTAEQRLTELSRDEETRLYYEAREKGIRDEVTRINAAREEGERIGERQIVQGMLRNGVDVETIVRMTGLSLERVRDMIDAE